ncbi:hypothetical protein R5R35_011148 [Gryllus longicercus]|uniref:glutathione transferase n=1 Tax=Gryllus longicercus TaxID=2509291 RepID=A0AAN9Z6Q5_9ORTH
MAPKYKVTYFNGMALGEPIRFILSHAGKEFEDIRIDLEQWSTLKKDVPFGKIPTLEVDGKTAHQSVSICRFLGREFGLAGENNWEGLQIDAVVDTIQDLRIAFADFMYAENKTVKAQKKEKLINETLPFYLSRLDEQVEINGGYFVNNKLSWADLYFAAITEYLKGGLEDDFISQYPNLKVLAEKVWNLPRIKAWREKRPKTQL